MHIAPDLEFQLTFLNPYFALDMDGQLKCSDGSSDTD